MNILIVDDSAVSRAFLSDLLSEAGYDNIMLAGSMEEVFDRFCRNDENTICSLVDLILLDITLPGKDGISGCMDLKRFEQFRDVPVIIVSDRSHQDKLEDAFAAGAVDYLRKPANKLELRVRVNAALQLKREMDRRKARERELLEMTERLEAANRELLLISSCDGLTGLANRHAGSTFISKEWPRAIREQRLFSVIMVDVDCFKLYNDTYGHLAGDTCLKAVANALKKSLKRPADLLVRYGGEEFMALLPGTAMEGALAVANAMQAAVATLNIPHSSSTAAAVVTVSIGVASMVPQDGILANQLIAEADRALYQAKQLGRNRICSNPA